MTEKCELLTGEALEVGHLALHFLAGGVGGGANTLDAQLEFVGVGGARKGFVEGDELLRVKIEEGLIERLHAVLAGAGGDGVVNQAGLVRVDDAIANVAGAIMISQAGTRPLSSARRTKRCETTAFSVAANCKRICFCSGGGKTAIIR